MDWSWDPQQSMELFNEEENFNPDEVAKVISSPSEQGVSIVGQVRLNSDTARPKRRMVVSDIILLCTEDNNFYYYNKNEINHFDWDKVVGSWLSNEDRRKVHSINLPAKGTTGNNISSLPFSIQIVTRVEKGIDVPYLNETLGRMKHFYHTATSSFNGDKSAAYELLLSNYLEHMYNDCTYPDLLQGEVPTPRKLRGGWPPTRVTDDESYVRNQTVEKLKLKN